MKFSNITAQSGSKKVSSWFSLSKIEKSKLELIKINPVFDANFFSGLTSDNYRTKFRKPINNLLQQLAKGTTKADKTETIAEIKKMQSILLKNGGFNWTTAKEFISEITAI